MVKTKRSYLFTPIYLVGATRTEALHGDLCNAFSEGRVLVVAEGIGVLMGWRT